MNRGGFSRFIPVILFVAVVVLVIIAFISIGRSIFGGEAPASDPGRIALTNTSNDRSVRMTARGPIVAEENHRSYRITVSPRERIFVSHTGYLERPIDRRELDNNSRAYEEFVYALDRLGLMNGNEGEGEATDLRGRCPKGSLYEFEVINSGGVVKRLWATTCRDNDDTLTADRKAVRDLFHAQVPEIRDLTRDLKIR